METEFGEESDEEKEEQSETERSRWVEEPTKLEEDKNIIPVETSALSPIKKTTESVAPPFF
jgi:hypothetical protein